MYKYHIDNGHISMPVSDFSLIKKTGEVIDAGTATAHLEYPNGLILDIVITIDGADVTSNKELVLNDKGDYVLKED